MAETRRHSGWIWVAAVVLAVLHHDFWLWDNRALLWGILPVGLAYHAVFSVAAAALWAMACRWAWPDHIEEWAEGTEGSGSSGEDHRP